MGGDAGSNPAGVTTEKRRDAVKVEDVKRKVEKIRSKSGDDEVAHSEEDALHRAVLHAIADGATNARELATAALETTRITFGRWYA